MKEDALKGREKRKGGESSTFEGNQSEGSSVTNQADAGVEPPKPDAWKYVSVSRTGDKKFKHDAISFDDPGENKTLKTNKGTAGIVEDKEPLYGADTIQEWFESLIELHEKEHQEIIECEDESHDHEFLEAVVVGRKQSLEAAKEELDEVFTNE